MDKSALVTCAVTKTKLCSFENQMFITVAHKTNQYENKDSLTFDRDIELVCKTYPTNEGHSDWVKLSKMSPWTQNQLARDSDTILLKNT